MLVLKGVVAHLLIKETHSGSPEEQPAELYRRRVTLAIWSLRKDYIYWPSKEERKVIAREIFQQYDFPHCVSLADGTLFPLAFEPETEDAPDYSGRKFGYSISTMIFCDHKRKVRHYTAGFPGSAHDNNG